MKFYATPQIIARGSKTLGKDNILASAEVNVVKVRLLLIGSKPYLCAFTTRMYAVPCALAESRYSNFGSVL